MKSYDPTDTLDQEWYSELAPEPWQIELLSMNPSYTGWGPGDDWMVGRGWSEPVKKTGWARESRPDLDDLNEVVNFYFSLSRPDGAPACVVSLVLWVLHPRKGASRGWAISGIQQADLPEVFGYLRAAADRNAARFAAVPQPSPDQGNDAS